MGIPTRVDPSAVPPRSGGAAAAERPARRFPRLVVWLAIATVVANAAFMAAVAWLGSTQLDRRLDTSADQVLTARLVGDGDVLLATRDSEVRLVREGEVAASAQIDAVVHDVAEASAGFLVASSAGVHLLDDQLRETARLEVTGTAVAVADTAAGPVVAHGAGAYTDQYWVSRFPPLVAGQSGEVEPVVQQQAAFTITALTVTDEVAYYGTLGAQVGAVDLGTGEQRWLSTGAHEVTAMAALPGQVLAADINGGITLFDADGGRRGTVDTDGYRATALAYDPVTGSLLAGDIRGRVHVLTEQGQRLLSQRVADNPIRLLHTLPDGGLFAMPESGRWAVLDLRAVDTTIARGRVVTGWLLFDVAALLTLLVSIVVTSARRRTRTVTVARRLWRGRQGYWFVLAAVVLVAYFFYWPSVMASYQSLTNFSLRSTTEWVGLENYRRAFADPFVRTGITNMVILTVTSFLKTITVPLLAAQLVYWVRNAAHGYFFRTAFVWASIPPGIVVVLLWKMIYDPHDGLINNLLAVVGLESWQRAWLGDSATAIWAIVGMGFPWLSVFAFLIFLGGLMSINRELYDSAAIDGANMWHRFRFIDLAHLLPQFRILVFLSITSSIEGFAGIFILTQGGPGYATYVPALQMYFNIGRGELGYASAIGVLLSILSLIVAWFILRFRRRVTEEAE